jgi:hypothetical protein
MSCLLFVEDEETHGKINIDDLYEKNQRRDLKQISIFNKLLNRIHKRINVTARNTRTAKTIWFTVPEYIFGEPVYDNGECIAYLVSKLETNGFLVKYMHPNTLFISWEKWVPSYVRSEFKKKTGMILNEKGQVIEKGEKGEKGDDVTQDTLNGKLFNDKTSATPPQKEQKQYTPIGQYKPTGNLVYNAEFFEKIEKRVS